jgi:hypothetical protein
MLRQLRCPKLDLELLRALLKGKFNQQTRVNGHSEK